MGNFELILNRIKDITGTNKNKEVAKLLNTNESTFGKWVARNKIPYEQIIKLCIDNDYDIKYIFTGNRQLGINSNQNIKNQNGINIQGNENNIFRSNEDNRTKSIIEAFNKLNEERKNYYYFKINAEALEI